MREGVHAVVHERNILRSPDLCKESPDMDGMGTRPPMMRLPGKSEVGNVLLSSNPWEQRELDKKREKLEYLQKKRLQGFEWSQRQFFINQIFDHNHDLRFTHYMAEKIKKAKREIEDEEELLDELLNKTYEENNGDDDGDDERVEMLKQSTKREKLHNKIKKLKGRGIFLPPLKIQTPRFKAIDSFSRKIGLKTLVNDNTIDENNDESLNVITLPSIQEECKTQRRESIDSAATYPRAAQLNKDRSKHQSVSALRRTLSENFETEDERIISTTMSLPDLDFRKEILDSESYMRDITEPLDEQQRKISKPRKEPIKIICKPEVVTRMTKTLPTALMVRANVNINAVINERKRQLKEKARKISEYDIFADQRWENLRMSLSEKE